jgi:hypothetical protein
VSDEISKLKDIVEKQNQSLKIYQEHFKKLQTEIETLKAELLKYRGY